MDTLNVLYLVGALLIFASIMASTLSARLGVPLLLIFLIVGMLAGEEGLLGIEFSQYNIANFIGQAALACILLDGGLRTSFQSFRVVAVTLATWGVFATGHPWPLCHLAPRCRLACGYVDGSYCRLDRCGSGIFTTRNGGVKLNDRVQATLELELILLILPP